MTKGQTIAIMAAILYAADDRYDDHPRQAALREAWDLYKEMEEQWARTLRNTSND